MSADRVVFVACLAACESSVARGEDPPAPVFAEVQRLEPLLGLDPLVDADWDLLVRSHDVEMVAAS